MMKRDLLLSALTGLFGTPELTEATAEDLRVLVCMVADPSLEGQALAKAAACSLPRVRAAVAYWQGTGILTEGAAPLPAAEPKPTPLASARELAPSTEAEDAAYIEQEKKHGLVDECQRILGRIFNPTEMAVVVGLSQQLGLDDAYILTLCSYCKSRGKDTLRYIERTAFGLFDQGIDTAEALEAHIKGLERAHTLEGALRRLLGAHDRKLTKTEEACLYRWANEFGYGEPVIGLAYDITVDTKQKVSVRYMDAILTRWHGAGCATLAQVEDLLEREQAARSVTRKQPPAPSRRDGRDTEGGSFDTDNFFAKALERSYGKEQEGD